MRPYDVLIIGGGLAGSLIAAMLGRAGVSAAVVDPHERYPADFRCEKLDTSQIAILEKTGIGGPVLAAATHFSPLWIARAGRLVQKRPNLQFGTDYDALVNAVRALIPASVPLIKGRAVSIDAGPELQRVTLSGGAPLTARLVVLASGLNHALRQSVGITREEIAASFSTSVGFDIAPAGEAPFDFPALTYYPERTSDGLAFLSLFPIGKRMRANMFAYWRPGDPRIGLVRHALPQFLNETMPGLRRIIGPYEPIGEVQLRPIDLYATSGHRRAGVVLAGDAFGSSCPAAGTGLNKVLTDAERLCNEYIPRWLATPGMAADKIAEFYADPAKREADAFSAARPFAVRALATDTGLVWRGRRQAKFLAQWGLGLLSTAGVGFSRLASRSAGAAREARDVR